MMNDIKIYKHIFKDMPSLEKAFRDVVTRHKRKNNFIVKVYYDTIGEVKGIQAEEINGKQYYAKEFDASSVKKFISDASEGCEKIMLDTEDDKETIKNLTFEDCVKNYIVIDSLRIDPGHKESAINMLERFKEKSK